MGNSKDISGLYFTITTNRETADNIERVLKDPLHAKRSVCLADIRHDTNYSIVYVKAREEGKKIEPEDIFWIGYFTQLQVSYNL